MIGYVHASRRGEKVETGKRYSNNLGSDEDSLPILVCLDLGSTISKYKHHISIPAHLASILYDNVFVIYFVPLLALAHTAEKVLRQYHTMWSMQLISPAEHVQ